MKKELREVAKSAVSRSSFFYIYVTYSSPGFPK